MRCGCGFPEDNPDERELLLAWLDFLRGAVRCVSRAVTFASTSSPTMCTHAPGAGHVRVVRFLTSSPILEATVRSAGLVRLRKKRRICAEILLRACFRTIGATGAFTKPRTRKTQLHACTRTHGPRLGLARPHCGRLDHQRPRRTRPAGCWPPLCQRQHRTREHGRRL